MSAGVLLTYAIIMYPAVDILLPFTLEFRCFMGNDAVVEVAFG